MSGAELQVSQPNEPLDTMALERAVTWSRAGAAGLSFRRIIEADLAFLAQVYAATRTDELAAVPWSEAEKAGFLAMQFDAQHRHYQTYYPDADWLVIARAGRDIGRLYLERWSNQFRIIDIAILPDHRGQGLGAALLCDLLDEAAAVGKDMSIHVERHNPAKRLYQRLGFVVEEDNGVYDLMRWRHDRTAIK